MYAKCCERECLLKLWWYLCRITVVIRKGNAGSLYAVHIRIVAVYTFIVTTIAEHNSLSSEHPFPTIAASFDASKYIIKLPAMFQYKVLLLVCRSNK